MEILEHLLGTCGEHHINLKTIVFLIILIKICYDKKLFKKRV